MQTQNIGATTYNGVFVVRRDGPKKLADLKGLRLALTSVDSLSGYAAPLAFLKAHNLGALDFSQIVLAGNHTAALESLARGEVDVTATFESAINDFVKRHPEFPLQYLDTIPGLPTDTLVMRRNLSAPQAQTLTDLLLQLGSQPGKSDEILVPLKHIGISGFTTYDFHAYDRLKQTLEL
jgi:ABC-type phosphate/phosphonate transport system substrate-binding protein